MPRQQRVAGEDLPRLEICRLAVALSAEGHLFCGRKPPGMEDGTGIAPAGLGLHMGDARAVATFAGDAQHRPMGVEAFVPVPGDGGGVTADAVRALFGRVEVSEGILVVLPPRSRDPAVPRVGEREPQFAEPGAGRERNRRQPPEAGSPKTASTGTPDGSAPGAANRTPPSAWSS